MAHFEKGDVVRLKSGGPKMTVEGIGEYGQAAMPGEIRVLCKWFYRTDVKTDTFEPTSLEKVEQPDSGDA